MINFWHLPAAASFLNGIAEDLREGSNVVVAVPEHTPSGWQDALRKNIRNLALPTVQDIAIDGELPIPTLHKTLSIGPFAARASVYDLCSNESFHNRIIHLQNITSTTWPTWKTFLCDYVDACRNQNLAERTLFIATLCGEIGYHTPQQTELLKVHQWLDKVDSTNNRLHAASLLGGSTPSHWQRQLAVAILSELALWDPSVIKAGTCETLDNLLSPIPWLMKIAKDRGWKSNDDLNAPSGEWHGLRQKYEGCYRTHSAWFALTGNQAAIERRVWAGQISTLFPLLERHRQSYIAKYKSIFQVPWSTKYTTYYNVEELELNHMAEQLQMQHSGGLRNVCEFVSWLSIIRNKLAHLTPVPAQCLLDPRFLDRMGNVLAHKDD